MALKTASLSSFYSWRDRALSCARHHLLHPGPYPPTSSLSSLWLPPSHSASRNQPAFSCTAIIGVLHAGHSLLISLHQTGSHERADPLLTCFPFPGPAFHSGTGTPSVIIEWVSEWLNATEHSGAVEHGLKWSAWRYFADCVLEIHRLCESLEEEES